MLLFVGECEGFVFVEAFEGAVCSYGTVSSLTTPLSKYHGYPAVIMYLSYETYTALPVVPALDTVLGSHMEQDLYPLSRE